MQVIVKYREVEVMPRPEESVGDTMFVLDLVRQQREEERRRQRDLLILSLADKQRQQRSTGRLL